MVSWSRELVSLRGRRVESWVGVEMALWGPADDDGSDPQFGGQEVPCLHLLGLQASLDHGGVVSVRTGQDDCFFGLLPSMEAEFAEGGSVWEGIYRWRPLTELPTGHVEDVAVLAAEGVLAEVHLRIGGQPLLLIAGELDGTPADGLLLHRLDDSVLAFTDLAAVEHASWTWPRSDLALIHP